MGTLKILKYDMFINYFRLIFINCSLMKTQSATEFNIKVRRSIPKALNSQVTVQGSQLPSDSSRLSTPK
jgi:hypothetical protein